MAGTPVARLPDEPDEQWAAVQRYAELGSVPAVSRSLGIPIRTAHRWSHRWEWKSRAGGKVRPDPPTPESAAIQAAVAPATLPPACKATVTVRPADLDRLREHVRERLAAMADEAVLTLESLARGELPPGPVDQRGRPLVPAMVALSAARAIVELSGVTPPKRVEITRPPDTSYQLVRDRALAMTAGEREILIRAFERVEVRPAGEDATE